VPTGYTGVASPAPFQWKLLADFIIFPPKKRRIGMGGIRRDKSGVRDKVWTWLFRINTVLCIKKQKGGGKRFSWQVGQGD